MIDVNEIVVAKYRDVPLVVEREGEVIFQVNWDGTVTGKAGDAGEAARIFAEQVASLLRPIRDEMAQRLSDNFKDHGTNE